ncbi:MAG: sugar-binding domain-containing protein, partial [Calditrichia bacterium]
LIWEEYPTWHNVFTPAELPTHRRQFPEWFRRDRHHPSIILRSISVEAGVKDQEVMGELVSLTHEMTDTPVQDNSSWFWLSNEKLTQWYGEDNYWNNDRWARHMLLSLPEKLNEMPEKPYIIGESMAGSIWPDLEALARVNEYEPLPGGLTGTDQPHNGDNYPYWFPAAYESMQKVEQDLRSRYNRNLGEEDIIRDYLIPQSRRYALEFRKFQISLMYADSQYAGWTVFIGRNVPGIFSGLYDEVQRPHWNAADWDWLRPDLQPPVTAAEVKNRNPEQPIIELAPELKRWDPAWGLKINNSLTLYYLKGGYSDLSKLFSGWINARETEESGLVHLPSGSVLVTNVLTYQMVDYLAAGGRVLLISSRWPGALKSQPHMFWGDAVLAPPAGPLSAQERDHLLSLQMFDLTQSKAEAIPTENLKINEKVEPLLRLFNIHGRDNVEIHDQLFATRVGNGLLIASSLDHTSEAGQWLLGRMLGWADAWENKTGRSFPQTRLNPADLKNLAVAKTNKIVMLTDEWRFKIDPGQKGDSLGWGQTAFADTGWQVLLAGRMWEGQGVDYDGMAWYRKQMDIPADWQKRKVVLVAEGVDDAYRLWVNGKVVALHGSFTEHDKTVFTTQTETDISEFLEYGKENLLALQVVDIFGGGGINRPIYLRIE